MGYSKIEFISNQQLLALRTLKGLPTEKQQEIKELIQKRELQDPPPPFEIELSATIKLVVFFLPFIANSILIIQLFTPRILLYHPLQFRKFWFIMSMGYCMWFIFTLVFCKYFLHNLILFY